MISEELAVLAAFERLRADPVAWASYLEECRQVDGVVGDWLRLESDTPSNEASS